MTAGATARALVLVVGAATTAGALVWWGLTFWPAWSYDYLPFTEASRCLLSDSTICRLAASLCTGQHRALVSIYSPVALWTGTILLLGGLGLRHAAR